MYMGSTRIEVIPHRMPLVRRPCQTLASDEHSNVLIYMNGHGGDQFLKFHDMEEVSSHDLGGALREMELKKRYHRVRMRGFPTNECIL